MQGCGESSGAQVSHHKLIRINFEILGETGGRRLERVHIEFGPREYTYLRSFRHMQRCNISRGRQASRRKPIFLRFPSLYIAGWPGLKGKICGGQLVQPVGLCHFFDSVGSPPLAAFTKRSASAAPQTRPAPIPAYRETFIINSFS